MQNLVTDREQTWKAIFFCSSVQFNFGDRSLFKLNLDSPPLPFQEQRLIFPFCFFFWVFRHNAFSCGSRILGCLYWSTDKLPDNDELERIILIVRNAPSNLARFKNVPRQNASSWCINMFICPGFCLWIFARGLLPVKKKCYFVPKGFTANENFRFLRSK